MKRSLEIEAVAKRYLRAIEDCDADALADLFSRDPGVRSIGTDPMEWFSGFEELVPVLAAQLAEARELGGLTVELFELEGYEEGQAGWAAARGEYRFVGRPNVPFRMTAVLVLERAHWCIVQNHFSAGTPNEESYGIPFTTALDDVHESLRVEQPNLGGVAAPDGTVSIVFTDMEDSTILAESIGDLEWLDLLHRHHRVVVESATAHRGFVVKSMGDGSMLAFASATEAIRCATRIVLLSGQGQAHRAVAVRAGIHAGDAIKDVNDFYGHTVTVAARVAALAAGGEILATRLIRDLTIGGDFRWSQSRSVKLRGLSEAYEVLALQHGAV